MPSSFISNPVIYVISGTVWEMERFTDFKISLFLSEETSCTWKTYCSFVEYTPFALIVKRKGRHKTHSINEICFIFTTYQPHRKNHTAFQIVWKHFFVPSCHRSCRSDGRRQESPKASNAFLSAKQADSLKLQEKENGKKQKENGKDYPCNSGRHENLMLNLVVLRQGKQFRFPSL